MFPDSLENRHSGAASLPPIINARLLSKAFGAHPLFRNVSVTVSEGERVGLCDIFEQQAQNVSRSGSGRRAIPLTFEELSDRNGSTDVSVT